MDFVYASGAEPVEPVTSEHKSPGPVNHEVLQTDKNALSHFSLSLDFLFRLPAANSGQFVVLVDMVTTY